jgi:uncharacterized membrane protein YdbT with pleckstrin-like domain
MSEKIELRQKYPLSFTMVIRKSAKVFCWFFLIALVSGLLFLVTQQIQDGFWIEVRQLFLFKKIFLVSLFGFLLVLRVGYSFLFWMSYKYFYENNRLYIETGVFRKREASIPLTFLSEFYLDRSWTDLFFGTRSLIIKTAMGEGKETARIDNLTEASAKHLRSLLVEYAAKNGQDSSLPRVA